MTIIARNERGSPLATHFLGAASLEEARAEARLLLGDLRAESAEVQATAVCVEALEGGQVVLTWSTHELCRPGVAR